MQRLKPLLAAAALVLLGFVVPSTNAAAAADKTINIGWTAWSDAEVVTRMAQQILEHRMGYKVKLTMADIGIQYQGIVDGDLDCMLMSWLPVTHHDYWVKVSDKVADLGILYTHARLGWVVPDYIPKSEVSSITDLQKPEVQKKLNDKIQGIDPGAGLMEASEKAIKAYHLNNYNLISASGAAMTAALQRAERRKQWIVVTGWSPHWMFAKWHLRYLKDPKRVLGGLEAVHALARKGLYQDHPDVVGFLSRMQLPLSDLQAVMYQADQTSYAKAVAAYIKSHPKRVNYWVTGQFK